MTASFERSADNWHFTGGSADIPPIEVIATKRIVPDVEVAIRRLAEPHVPKHGVFGGEATE